MTFYRDSMESHGAPMENFTCLFLMEIPWDMKPRPLFYRIDVFVQCLKVWGYMEDCCRGREIEA